MKRRKLFVWIVPAIAFAAVVFSSTRAATAPVPVLPPSPVASAPILRLVGRNHSMTVVSTPTGPRFSATDRTGAILADGLSLEELRSSRPALYREVSPGLAASSASTTPFGTGIMADLGD